MFDEYTHQIITIRKIINGKDKNVQDRGSNSGFPLCTTAVLPLDHPGTVVLFIIDDVKATDAILYEFSSYRIEFFSGNNYGSNKEEQVNGN